MTDIITSNAESIADSKGELRVFVYGSLKEGKGNDHFLQSGARKLGRAGIQLPARLLNFGGFPGVQRQFETERAKVGPRTWTGEDTILVLGEVYSVTEQTFIGLDFLEGYPSFYQRHQYHLSLVDPKTSCRAWCYTLPSDDEQYNGMDDKEAWLEIGPNAYSWMPVPNEREYWSEYFNVMEAVANG